MESLEWGGDGSSLANESREIARGSGIYIVKIRAFSSYE
jgi:hypothetical protein